MTARNASDIEKLRFLIIEISKTIRYIIENQSSYMVEEVLKENGIEYRLIEEGRECKERLHKIIYKFGTLSKKEWEVLEVHGLTGSQLDLKISTFKSLKKRFDDSVSWLWIRRFLKFSDSILGSINNVLPELGFVIEFKELIETLVKRRGKLPKRKER